MASSEKMRRGCRRESVSSILHPWKISVKNSKLFSSRKSILYRFFIVIPYLLQLPLILLKMWYTNTVRCFFSKAESINFDQLETIDASCAAYRDEDVAGRWAKILLALRGDMFRNSSLTRREIKKIASSIGHTEFISVCLYHLEELDRQISERR